MGALSSVNTKECVKSLPQIIKVLVAMFPNFTSINHVKLTPEWVLIRVNFDPIQEIGPKVGSWRSFEGGCSFTRLWYKILKQ